MIMDFLKELWLFLKIRKKFWMLPIFFILVLFGGIIVASKGSVIAPLIYTVF